MENIPKKEELVWCDRCKKYILWCGETKLIKLQHWDLFCIHCDNWIGGMKDFYGWEIQY